MVRRLHPFGRDGAPDRSGGVAGENTVGGAARSTQEVKPGGEESKKEKTKKIGQGGYEKMITSFIKDIPGGGV